MPLARPVTVLPNSDPDRTTSFQVRSTQCPRWQNLVELVIGVDTHSETHTAAVVAVGTRAVLATATVTADEDGYTELVALADQ